jgi:GNAT superfamily N-acetyltransferase
VSAAAFEPTLVPPASPGVIVALERAVYGDAEVADAAFVEWLYARNPAGEGIVWYAPTGDAATPSAGHVATVPLRVEVRGRPGVAALIVNVVTHPRWRGRGVLARLAAHAIAENARRGFCHSFGFANPKSTPGFLHHAGFHHAGRVPLLLSPLDPKAVAVARTGPARLALRLVARALAAVGAARREHAQSLPVEEVPADWEGFDALWARLRGRRPLGFVRDRAFTSWRFGSCPTRRYRLFAVQSGGDVAGMVVTRLAPVLGLSAGHVVDLALAPGPDAPAAGAALLARARDEFAAGGVALAASLMLPHTAEYRALRAAGFFPCPRLLEPQPFHIIMRAHVPEVPPTLSGWFVTMADYDVI